MKHETKLTHMGKKNFYKVSFTTEIARCTDCSLGL